MDEALNLVLPDWSRLWSVAEKAARVSAEDPRYVFEPIGLFLDPSGQPSAGGHEATPPGAFVFGSTGGDGVHFSAVVANSKSLIVMTVPMRFDHPNVAVGGSLMEFLALGCRHGYFGLEQLAYDYARTAQQLAVAPGPMEDQSSDQLAQLRSDLQLDPWPVLRPRLDELQELLERSL